jgi:hypothetical protein
VPRPRAWAARACSTSSSRDDLLTSGFGHAGEPTHDLNTSLMERESLSRPLRQRRWPLCRGFVDLRDRVSPASCVGRRRETSRCVARTADVSGMCPRVLDSGNTKVPSAGTSCKPSDGLEPSTPSLPSCNPAFPCNLATSFAKRTLPRRALSIPENPRTCPQNLPPVIQQASLRITLTMNPCACAFGDRWAGSIPVCSTELGSGLAPDLLATSTTSRTGRLCKLKRAKAPIPALAA